MSLTKTVLNNSSVLKVNTANTRHCLTDVVKTEDWSDFHFTKITESTVSRAMTSRYFKDVYDYAIADVIIVGAGSSGLSAAYVIAKARPDLKVVIIESSLAPGGGCWVSGMLYSAQVVRKPAHLFLDELEVPYEDEGDYVVVKHAALFTSTITSKVLSLPNVKFFNAVTVEDLVTKPCEENDKNSKLTVSGVVINWTLVTMAHDTQSCMDPNVIELSGYNEDGTRDYSKKHGVILSATGHDGPFGAFCAKRIAALEPETTEFKSMKGLDMNKSEDEVVKHAGSHKGGVDSIFFCGMEEAEIYGLSRMGPTFGAMFVSGIKAGEEILKHFAK
ncbi:probable Thiamine thiazole synthase [Saccharomycodes ludwigii]|uniref:Probable Thiamine thiazole synthase n=1 Tax=Saccharomycodes ludwigii TaxID=36035 RepID=A0A376BAK7_9ASCO|nr:hypothetical protein SCDLUD_003155 [Saccharomycodes ludwigii]KAH3900184.1 hypothetical protein SCDLUD_003155 [Saccharomycodes ludwigii]SSD61160.1 probable Thiamine thiazole synthase [Saccharomycodes ludwigii]